MKKIQKIAEIIPILEQIESGELRTADINYYNIGNGGVFNNDNKLVFEWTLRGVEYVGFIDDIDIWYEMTKYWDWEIINYWCNDAISDFENFMKKFTRFIKKNKNRYNRMWYALFAEYDPTENVFEYEKEKNTKEGTVDHNGGIVVTYQNGKVMTRVKGQQSDTYTDNSRTSTNYATAFDTSAELETDKNVSTGGYTMQHGSGTDTDTASGSDVETKSGKDWDKYDIEENRDFNKHGNIGVMKTQDMIEAELLLRTKDLVAILVREFVSETGYMHIALEDLKI